MKSEGSAAEFRIATIIERIRRIPKSSVQTYGGIDPNAPRLVGRILAPTNVRVPWYRVVRADGSLPKGQRQRDLLEAEGVPMRGKGVDLKRARATASPASRVGLRRRVSK